MFNSGDVVCDAMTSVLTGSDSKLPLYLTDIQRQDFICVMLGMERDATHLTPAQVTAIRFLTGLVGFDVSRGRPKRSTRLDFINNDEILGYCLRTNTPLSSVVSTYHGMTIPLPGLPCSNVEGETKETPMRDAFGLS